MKDNGSVAGISVSIRIFLHRHKNLFTVIGAGVVLVTFVLKEVIQEPFKSKIESLNSANEHFASRTDSIIAQSALLQVKINVDETELFTRPKGVEAEMQRLSDSLDNENDTLSKVIDLIDESNNDVVELQKQSNYDPKIAADLKKSSRQVEEFKKNGAALQLKSIDWKLDYRDFTASNDPNFDESRNIAGGIRGDLFVARSKALGELSRCIEVRNRAAEQAHKTADEMETRSKRYSSYGFILFAFGWVLGLVGQLLGIKGAEGSE